MSHDADVIVIGAGGGGLVAAIAAAEKGASVILLEKTTVTGGHTLMTQGMFPAAGSRLQKEMNVEDSAEIMTDDILEENHHDVEYEVVRNLADNSPLLAEWMTDYCGIPLQLVTDFKYHGYTNFRIHAPPSRTGKEVIQYLLEKAESLDNLEIILEHGVQDIIADGNGGIGGVIIAGSGEQVTAGSVIVATGGYGANRDLVERHMPEAASMAYFGSTDHRGESVMWGEKLGAELNRLDSYQAHSSVSSVGTLITWQTVMNGAIIVNRDGERFGFEQTGYSAFASHVVRQPGSVAFEIFNSDIHSEVYSRYEEYRETASLGGVSEFSSIEDLAEFIGCSAQAIGKTIEENNRLLQSGETDNFGRSSFIRLEAPYYAAKISPALFHTQGGPRVDRVGRVVMKSGETFRNLYAVGDAAAGVSGHGADGYTSGTGLLCAFVYGWLAGRDAAENVLKE